MRNNRLILFAVHLVFGYLMAFLVAASGAFLAQFIKYPIGYTGYPPFSLFEFVVLPVLLFFAPWALASFGLIFVAAGIVLSPEHIRMLSFFAISVLTGFIVATVMMAYFFLPFILTFGLRESEFVIVRSALAGCVGASAGLCVGAWSWFFHIRSHPEMKVETLTWTSKGAWASLLSSIPFLVSVTLTFASFPIALEGLTIDDFPIQPQ